MNKSAWDKLKFEFYKAHNKTGVSVKTWCCEKQLKYNTVRRHVKIKDIGSLFVDYQPSISRRRHKRRGPPLGSQNALKHGGYSTPIDIQEDYTNISKCDEFKIILARYRIHKAIQTIMVLNSEVECVTDVKQRAKIYSEMFQADKAICINISQIQSSSMRLAKKQMTTLEN